MFRYLNAMICIAVMMAMAPLAIGATIVVNTFEDEFNSDGDCSLREAVNSANNDFVVDACTVGDGVDTIELPAGTYTISVSGSESASLPDDNLNDLDVTEDTVIRSRNGDATDTRIEPAEGYTGRAFEVAGSGSTLTVQDITVRGFDTGAGASGGAFKVTGQTLVLERVVLSGNQGNASGAIGSSGSDTIIIRDSALVDNVATNSSFGGGALGFNSNEIQLENVTFLRNHAAGNGGAIAINAPGHSLSMDNVTMVGNSASNDGGGLHIAADSSLDIRNSIISGNHVGGSGPECALTDGLTLTGSRDYNLWTIDGSCFDSLGSHSVETEESGLAMGGYYDGTSIARPPLTSSPAIDGGSCTDSSGGDISGNRDQRNASATRNADGNGDGTAACDIGSIERQRQAFHAESTADTDDASPGDESCADAEGRCTLRAAIDEANALTGLDEVLLGAEDYVLTQTSTYEDGNLDGDLDVSDSVIIRGQGARSTVVDAGGISRAFHVPRKGSGRQRTLALADLTIRNGNSGAPDNAPDDASGGAVYVNGLTSERNELLAERVRFTGNQAVGTSSDGGALAVDFGILRLQASTIDANEAERFGSAIGLSGGARGWIQSTTISGNRAGTGDAVGIFGGAHAHLERVTIADNEGFRTALGGNATASVHNSIIGAGGTNPCHFTGSGSLTSLGHNLDETSDCALSEPSDRSNATADLASLSSSGADVPLRTPLQGSHAVGTGSCQTATGYILPPVVFNGTRPQDGAGFGNARGDGSYSCDIGAAERQSVAVSLGDNSPGDREMTSPSGEVVMAQFTLANEAGEPLDGRVLTLRAYGTGDEARGIEAANLYIDTNADGALDDNDTLVDSVTALDDDGELRFEFSGSESAIPSGGELQLIVTYRFSESLATNGIGTTRTAAQYASPGLMSLFVLAAFAPFRRQRLLLLLAVVALAGCSGGGGGGDEETVETDEVEEAVPGTYSLELQSLSVEGDNGGKLGIRTESVPGNTLTVKD
ncbi:CSLREA domain-containing protein [Halospina denitrificans]|uniref:CSLREA domain-containing protein n=1 Tax=Halospina denitrificans TaxID=332522 RepID=A0A4R7K0Y9_9GAMM|nr:CSLREA domain-containing protein [Halospina denitrificans]TDT44235.1 CSLREA domain-containing protein [Halospina denitrificans]